MRIVILTRAPRWFSFRGDRLIGQIHRAGHEIVGIVVEPRSAISEVREVMAKIGLWITIKKAVAVGLRMLDYRPGKAAGGADTPRTATSSRDERHPVYFVDSHDSPACVELLRSLEPDVIVLRGCGIIRKPVIGVPKIGVLNAHYGSLPRYRGVNVTEWAVLQGETPCVTVHFVDGGVDTGAILLTRNLRVEATDSLATLREKSGELAADLLVEALDMLAQGVAQPVSQVAEEGRQYFLMHPRLRKMAEQRFRDGVWR